MVSTIELARLSSLAIKDLRWSFSVLRDKQSGAVRMWVSVRGGEALLSSLLNPMPKTPECIPIKMFASKKEKLI